MTIGRVGLLAFALGIGAAVIAGTATANADTRAGNDTEHSSTGPARTSAAAPARDQDVRTPLRPAAARTARSDTPASPPRSIFRTVGRSGSRSAEVSPASSVVAPTSKRLIMAPPARRTGASAPRNGSPVSVATAVAPAPPSPADQVGTQYGDIGTWMLKPNGQISDYGGQLDGGKKLLEPVNVVLVDPTSRTAWMATWKLSATMRKAGFPAQAIHSGGFRGLIDNKTYRQQPTGLLGFSDDFFLLTNDHGRMFGPAPVKTSSGYVWTGAFSTEEWGTYNGRPAHLYVSSNAARDALATALVVSGQATDGGRIALGNTYNTDSTTTGDHDGDAVVLILN